MKKARGGVESCLSKNKEINAGQRSKGRIEKINGTCIDSRTRAFIQKLLIDLIRVSEASCSQNKTCNTEQ